MKPLWPRTASINHRWRYYQSKKFYLLSLMIFPFNIFEDHLNCDYIAFAWPRQALFAIWFTVTQKNRAVCPTCGKNKFVKTYLNNPTILWLPKLLLICKNKSDALQSETLRWCHYSISKSRSLVLDLVTI